MPVVCLSRARCASWRGAAAWAERLGAVEPLEYKRRYIRARAVDAEPRLRAAVRSLAGRFAVRRVRARKRPRRRSESRFVGGGEPAALVHGAGALVRRRD